MIVTTRPATAAIHPLLVDAARALAQSQVRWALLRLPEGGLAAPESDVDLLVHPDDVRRMLAALAPLALVRVPRSGNDFHLLRYSESTDRWLWLHATTTVAFDRRRSAKIIDAADILARRRLEEGIPRLDDDAEFWLLLWHCLTDKGRVPPHHRTVLSAGARGASSDSGPARACGAAWNNPSIVPGLLRAVAANDWPAVEACAPACRASQRSMRWLSFRRLRAAVQYRFDALAHWQERRGLSVAALGPDGAGKSTLVAGIAASMPFPSRTIYMGLTGGALRHVRRLRVPGLVFVARACIVWSRYVRAWAHMAQGRLVLFDRYVYDAAAPPGHAQSPLERMGRRLSGYLCPSPDLVLLLDAPGAVMFARKVSYDAARLESWRQCFRSLSSRLDRLEIIDATQPAASVRREAVARIWRRYVERWRGVATVSTGATR
jgi:thymidylate kinase